MRKKKKLMLFHRFACTELFDSPDSCSRIGDLGKLVPNISPYKNKEKRKKRVELGYEQG